MKNYFKITLILVVIIIDESFSQEQVNKYEIFEVVLEDKINGNPYGKVELKATFKHEKDQKVVRDFYDGDGRFIIRFMPQLEGAWKYVTTSNRRALNKKSGQFMCISASDKNHGFGWSL